MKYIVDGKGFSAVVTVEDGTLKETDNESISILVGKNWDHVKGKCKEWGWAVMEVPEVNILDLTASIKGYYYDEGTGWERIE